MMYERGFYTLDRCFGYGYGHLWGGGGLLMLAAAVLVTVVIIAVVVALVRKMGHRESRASVSEAMETLNLRYIKDEITEEEYNRMKKIIQNR